MMKRTTKNIPADDVIIPIISMGNVVPSNWKRVSGGKLRRGNSNGSGRGDYTEYPHRKRSAWCCCLCRGRSLFSYGALFLVAATMVITMLELSQLNSAAMEPGKRFASFLDTGFAECLSKCLETVHTNLAETKNDVTFCQKLCSNAKGDDDRSDNNITPVEGAPPTKNSFQAENLQKETGNELVNPEEEDKSNELATSADVVREELKTLPADNQGSDDQGKESKSNELGPIADVAKPMISSVDDQKPDEQRKEGKTDELTPSADVVIEKLETPTADGQESGDQGKENKSGKFAQNIDLVREKPENSFAGVQESGDAKVEPEVVLVAEQTEATSVDAISGAKGEMEQGKALPHETFLKEAANLAIWLTSERGVETDRNGAVQSWHDQSTTFPKVKFVPTNTESHVHDIFGHENHVSENGEPILKNAEIGHLPMVSFPCALETHDYVLRTELTALFVLSPEVMLYGPAARGQRFFGHYPNGQFRFADGSPSLFANGDKKMTSINPNVDMKSEHGLVLLKYRLSDDTGVEIGVNRDPFEIVHNGGVEMSTEDSLLSIGGVNGGCGFRGRIGEVLIFNEALGDVELNRHIEYLETKWWSHHDQIMGTFQEEKQVQLDKVGPATTVSASDSSKCSHYTQPFDTAFEALTASTPIQLWLKTDYGVVVNKDGTNEVMQWESAPPSDAFTFVLTPNFHRKKGVSKPKLVVDNNCNSYVKFGCSLVSNAAKLTMPMSVYMVVDPEPLTHGKADSAMQRLFGNFPNGGFVYDGVQPMFKSKDGFLVANQGKDREQQAKSSKQNNTEFVLLRYRIGPNGVEIAKGVDTVFQKVGPEYDSVFSQNRFLTVGGTNSGCEFNGGIGEILVFQGVLEKRKDAIVSKYLRTKWHLFDDGIVDDAAGNTITESNHEKAQKLAVCISYDRNDPVVMDWIPPIESTLPEQRRMWADLVQKDRIALSKVPKQNKLVESRNLNAKLLQDRIRIFGPPCKVKRNEHHGKVEAMQSPKEEESVSTQNQVNKPPISPTKSFVLPDVSTINKGVAVSATEPSDCHGVKRPFSNDILNWKAPMAAKSEARYVWEDAVEQAQKEIRQFVTGGDELLKFLKGVARKLNDLRDRLFENTCDDPKEPVLASSVVSSSTQKIECDKTSDILLWKIPSSATKDAQYEWEDAIDAAKQEIAKFTKGGDALHQFLKNLVRGLERIRSSLFSSLCSNV